MEIINITKLLPRHRIRSQSSLNYWKRRKTYPPINVCYTKDIDKLIILNGHHRYYSRLERKEETINIIVDKVQLKTKFNKYNFPEVNRNG